MASCFHYDGRFLHVNVWCAIERLTVEFLRFAKIRVQEWVAQGDPLCQKPNALSLG